MESEKTNKFIKIMQKMIVYLIEDIPFRFYGYIFVLAVLIFSILYLILTPFGHGIGNDGKPIENLTFWSSVYFSIVTVSSLGYGDMAPMGVSRIFTCLEVLSGLVLMGIMLAKLTSARLSYHVARLFSSEIQKRIEHFAKEFDRLVISLPNVTQSITSKFQEIPERVAATARSRKKVIDEFTNIATVFRHRSSGLADYISYEVEHCNFFSIAPIDSMVNMAETINQTVFLFGQIILGMTIEARKEVLIPLNRKLLLEAVGKTKNICWIIHEHCTNRSIRDKYSEILRVCESFPESFFAVPTLVAEEAQPDQALERSDEPQH